MTATDFNDVSRFEETEVSSQITAEDSAEFFKECGIFYQANAEIGQRAAALQGVKYSVQHIEDFKPIIDKDQRLANVLNPFLVQSPSFCHPVGPDPGNFYSLTIEENQDHRAIIYMWYPGTKVEFSYGSHVGPAKGLRSSNGRVHRPYVNLSKTRGLKDVSINMEEGGIIIVHARLAFQILSGKAIGFGCENNH